MIYATRIRAEHSGCSIVALHCAALSSRRSSYRLPALGLPVTFLANDDLLTQDRHLPASGQVGKWTSGQVAEIDKGGVNDNCALIIASCDEQGIGTGTGSWTGTGGLWKAFLAGVNWIPCMTAATRPMEMNGLLEDCHLSGVRSIAMATGNYFIYCRSECLRAAVGRVAVWFMALEIKVAHTSPWVAGMQPAH